MPFSECSILSQELFFAVIAWFFISFCLGVYEHLPDRNRIWLSQIGNSGSGERGGSLYIEYSGSNADGIKIQVRDTSANKNVITQIPYLNIQPSQWYGKSENERKALLTPYVEALKAQGRQRRHSHHHPG